MLLAIDAGNSNIKLALFDKSELKAQWRLTSNDLSQLADLVPQNLDAILVASVVPALNPTLTRICEDHLKLTPVFVDHTTPTGLKILYDSPAELGADRIVDAVAAVAKYGAPCIVVDFGTATTFNAINAASEFLGGAISPGLMTCSEALFARAAKLPRVNFEKPERVIGSSTVTAIQSGLYHGYTGLVDGVLERMIAEMNVKPRVIATGGLAHAIASRYIELRDDTLTLEGLRLVYERIKN
ncbi:MAG TPA: type III pantothenate kinase [Pyrinomonadaceae bacterium]